MIPRPNNQIYKSVLVVWISLSIGSVILAAVNWLRLSNEHEAGIRATAIQDSLNGVMKSVLDAETAQRGFTIAGSEGFLEPLNEAEARLPARFDGLVELVRQDSNLLRQVTELRALAEVSMAFQRKVV